MALVLYSMICLLLTGGSFDLLENGDPLYWVGIFSDLALSLLSGSAEVSREVAGSEGFVVNGRTVVYWGVWPALFRMAFSPFYDLALYDLTRLSMACAAALALSFKIVAVIDACAPGGQRFSFRLCVLAVAASLASGMALTLLVTVGVWFEIALWDYAFAVAFVTLLLRYLDDPARRTALLPLLAVITGLCLNTRPTTGVGLGLALGVCLLALPGAARLKKNVLAIWTRAVAGAAPLVGLFLLMNQLRWGSPWSSLDMSASPLFGEQRWNLEAYGLFNPLRAAEALNYYFLPLWGYLDGFFGWSRAAVANELFYALEPPFASFFLLDAFWLLCAGLGLAALLSGTRGYLRGRLLRLGILAALLVPIAAILCFYYQAHRYRVEFYPLIYFLAFTGLRRLAASPAAAILIDRAVQLVILQVAYSAFVGAVAVLGFLGRRADMLSDGMILYLFNLSRP